MIRADHPDDLAARADHDLGGEGSLRASSARSRPLRDRLPDHEGARRADVDGIETVPGLSAVLKSCDTSSNGVASSKPWSVPAGTASMSEPPPGTAAMKVMFLTGIWPLAARSSHARLSLRLAALDDLEDGVDTFLSGWPGLGPPVADGVHFVIGPSKQLDAHQEYLHAAAARTATLHRLYPRDFWIPAKL